jgi:O-antigen/teichoic acid export membrane protein
MINKIQKFIYPASTLLAIVISILIYLIIPFIPDYYIYYENFIVLIILLFSIVLISGFIPFEIILTLGGHPGLQSILTVSTLIFNIFLNLLLVPYFFATGAAFATGASYIFGAILLNFFVFRVIGVKIL